MIVVACKASELPPGQARQIAVAGRAPLAVFNIDGSFYTIDDTCTHGQASLCEGLLDGTIVECPFHFGTFDVRTGEPLAFPCTIPLRSYPTRVEGENVLVEL